VALGCVAELVLSGQPPIILIWVKIARDSPGA